MAVESTIKSVSRIEKRSAYCEVNPKVFCRSQGWGSVTRCDKCDRDVRDERDRGDGSDNDVDSDFP